MKRFLVILTALLLCFPFLSVGGPRALADGNDCFLSASFPSVYNEVLKRDFLTVLTQDPSAGNLQFFPYQLMFRSQSGVSELYATSDGLVRLSFEYDSPDEVGVSGRPASSMVLTVPADYDSLKQNAYMLSLIHALSQLDPGFSESTATMLMLTAGPSPVTLDVSMGQLSAQLLDGEYTFTLTRSGASVSPPAASDAGNTADLPAQQDISEPVVTAPPEAPAPVPSSNSSGSFSALAPGSVIMSASGVEVRYTGIQHVVFDDEVDLKVLYSIVNNSGRDIVLRIEGAQVNGVTVGTVGISILKDGESAEDQIYIEPVDTASQQAICNPSSLSVALTLRNRDRYQELAAGALNMAVSLPATTPKPNSKFPVDVDFSSGAVSIGNTVMSLSGVEVRYTGIQHVVFDDKVDLKVLYSIVNNSGRDIVLNIEGAQVNGIAADTVGISILKAGESDNDQIYIEPSDAASLQAICNPYSLSVDLLLKDGSSYEELGRTTFRLSDISLPAVTPKPGSKFSSDSVPTPVPRTPSSSVSRPLVFPDNANGQWEYVGSDQLRFRCQVQNVSSSDSISAFELYLYPTDARGSRLIDADAVYYHTTNRQIYPGQTAYSDYFTIGDRNVTANIYVGIKRVILADGTVCDYDDVEYWCWTIK